MAERPLYRATKEGERRVASSARFRVLQTLGSYRAPVKSTPPYMYLNLSFTCLRRRFDCRRRDFGSSSAGQVSIVG